MNKMRPNLIKILALTAFASGNLLAQVNSGNGVFGGGGGGLFDTIPNVARPVQPQNPNVPARPVPAQISQTPGSQAPGSQPAGFIPPQNRTSLPPSSPNVAPQGASVGGAGFIPSLPPRQIPQTQAPQPNTGAGWMPPGSQPNGVTQPQIPQRTITPFPNPTPSQSPDSQPNGEGALPPASPLTPPARNLAASGVPGAAPRSGWLPPTKPTGVGAVASPTPAAQTPDKNQGEGVSRAKLTEEPKKSEPVADDNDEDNKLRPEIKFVDAPYAGVMRALAKQAGISYMESNLSSEESLTVTLKNITPLAAFKTIADFRGFKVRVEDGIYTLSRADIDGTQSLVTKKYRICHLDPTWVEQEIANLLGINKIEKPGDSLDTIPKPKDTGISAGGGGGQGGGGASSTSGNSGGSISTKPRWLPSLPFDSPASTGGLRSEFGSGNPQPSAIWVDRRDNAIVVRASKDEHAMVEEYIKANDHPEPLIVIDCRVVQVNEKVDSTAGVDWQQMFGSGQGQGFTATFKGLGADINSVSGFFKGFTGGVIVNTTNAQVTLQDWEQSGKARVIDSPRVVTKSGVPVSMVSVTEYPITLQSTPTSGNNGGTAAQNQLSSGTQTFTWGVTMDVLPRLLANNFVDLNINPIVSDNLGFSTQNGGISPQSQTSQQQGNSNSNTNTNNSGGGFQGIPVIAKRQTTTTVRVQSDQTVVIGGLMQDKAGDSVNGVPPLSKIPLVGGYLFGQKTKVKERTNLLIFVTPHVIPPDEVVEAETEGAMAKAVESAKRLENKIVRGEVKMSDEGVTKKNRPEQADPDPVVKKVTKKKIAWPWGNKKKPVTLEE